MKYLLGVLLIFSTPAIATDEVDPAFLMPDYFVSQTAGYVGFLAYGIGYSINSSYSSEILLGYTPKLIADEDLFSLGFKNSLLLEDHKIGKTSLLPYLGVTTLVSINDTSNYILLPEKYPARYYPPTGIRLAPYIGLEVEYEDLRFFLEGTSLDHYLETYVRSQGSLPFREVVSYGFGGRVDF